MIDTATNTTFGPAVGVGTTPTGAALIGGIPPEEREEPTDVTPPEISADVSGTLGDNGWFVSEVKVSYTASDADSGIDTDASDLETTSCRQTEQVRA